MSPSPSDALAPRQFIAPPTDNTNSHPVKGNWPIIVGAVVGGVVALLPIALLIYYVCLRRRQRRRELEEAVHPASEQVVEKPSEFHHEPPPVQTQPSPPSPVEIPLQPVSIVVRPPTAESRDPVPKKSLSIRRPLPTPPSSNPSPPTSTDSHESFVSAESSVEVVDPARNRRESWWSTQFPPEAGSSSTLTDYRTPRPSITPSRTSMDSYLAVPRRSFKSSSGRPQLGRNRRASTPYEEAVSARDGVPSSSADVYRAWDSAKQQ